MKNPQMGEKLRWLLSYCYVPLSLHPKMIWEWSMSAALTPIHISSSNLVPRLQFPLTCSIFLQPQPLLCFLTLLLAPWWVHLSSLRTSQSLSTVPSPCFFFLTKSYNSASTVSPKDILVSTFSPANHVWISLPILSLSPHFNSCTHHTL